MSAAESNRRAGAPLAAAELVGAFLRSSVGAKVIMAVTGAGLWTFVIVHLLGNLQIFQGADAINSYGVFLRELAHGGVVWVARGGLAACFLLHIYFGVRLAAKNRAARPVNYEKSKRRVTSLASIWMAMSGALVLAFLAFHLAHTTWGLVLPEYFTTTTKTSFADGTPAHDVYSMMSNGFTHPWLVVLYVLGQVVLLAHLAHGSQSLWQSLGWHHATWSPVLALLGRLVVAAIVVLNISMPLWMFFRGGVSP